MVKHVSNYTSPPQLGSVLFYFYACTHTVSIGVTSTIQRTTQTCSQLTPPESLTLPTLPTTSTTRDSSEVAPTHHTRTTSRETATGHSWLEKSRLSIWPKLLNRYKPKIRLLFLITVHRLSYFTFCILHMVYVDISRTVYVNLTFELFDHMLVCPELLLEWFLRRPSCNTMHSVPTTLVWCLWGWGGHEGDGRGVQSVCVGRGCIMELRTL